MKMDNSGNRRTFLKKAALCGGFAVLLSVGKPAVVKPKQPLPKPEPSGQGYRLTEHIEKYYETARA